MLAFPGYRRSAPDIQQIRPGRAASGTRVRRLERRCRAAGLRITDLRRILLHGILKTGEDATAIDIWKTLTDMVDGHVPGHGSLQRNLNLMVERGIMQREVGVGRVWCYRLLPDDARSDGDAPLVSVLEAETGRRSRCDLPEVAAFLQRLAAARRLTIRSAAITVETIREASS